ncbi:MAG: EFR1 family ferrodoxin [Candidatus Lokiarchaeota archaeon]|nr:EFR1 family ferrodoxin [Candidatus Lokiarchaeota archaeon]
MKTTIYFFTGTGNSLNIAKSISKKFENCELVPIAKVWQVKNLTAESEKVGFIFPLYYSGLPKIVYDFVKNININKSEYFFAVVISGGGTSELPFQQIGRILNSKEKGLNAGFLISMPSNYIISYDIHSEEQQKIFFEKASEQVAVISEMVKNKGNNFDQEILEKNLSRTDRFNTKFRDNVNESDKSFFADENCNNCGICEEICPVNNIILVEGKPQWQHKCQQCLACINYCPEKSIQFGSQTKRTGRYHHPEISLQDIKTQKK